MQQLMKAFAASDAAGFSSSFRALSTSEKLRVRDGENPIPCQAARREKRKILEACMDADPWCLTSIDPDFRTPLHWAAMNGDMKACKMLLEKKPERVKVDKLMTVRDSYGMVILHCAALSGNEELLCFLLDTAECSGAMCQNKDGLYPIQLACMKGYARAVRKICASTSRAAVENMKDASGSTLLHLTVMEGHCDVAKVLLEAGVCDLSAKDADGGTALSLAQDLADLEMVELIGKFSKLKQAAEEDFHG